jgi:hypothetical protein
MESNVKIGSGLQNALKEALSKSTEKERTIAVLDCIRGYRNEYDMTEQKAQFEGFTKCKSEYRHQIDKIKEFVGNHNF